MIASYHMVLTHMVLILIPLEGVSKQNWHLHNDTKPKI